MNSIYYNYKYEIIRPGGNILTVTVSSDGDLKASLKAKYIAKTMKGRVGKFTKEPAPYKTKDEKVNKILESMLQH